ncbi:MAG: dockerin type I repeat-containing protein [Ruminococcus flavefaciens]|nr:dockerin type I repeat-containing protein [Ruminococcus flavefaciens]
MNKKLIAMMSAMVMSFSAVPFTANATEEPEILPDWIPQTFTEALHFANEYGKTHIEDGLICCVRQKSLDERYEYTTEYSDDDSMSLLTLSSETYSFVMPEKPDESDTEAYQEYLDFLNENYISESYVEYFGEVKASFEYEVTVYSMNPSGSVEINWRKESADTGEVWDTTTLTFESSENGEITETDIYGWFPDAPAESILEPVSVINNHIVFCDYICTDGGFSLLFEQTGTAELECVAESYLNGAMVTVSAPGGSNKIARAYKPLDSGTVKVTFTQAQDWKGGSVGDVTTKYYDVDEDGNITEIEGISAGDCNDDGKFTVSDVVMFQKWLSGKGDITKWQNADFTWDNNLDVFDLTIMKQELLKTLPEITAKTDNVSADDITILKSEILCRFPDTDMSDFSFRYSPDTDISRTVFDVYYKGLLVHGCGNISFYDSSVYASIIRRNDGLREVIINLVQSPEDIMAVDTHAEIIDRYEMKKMLDSEEYPELIIYVDYEDKPVLAYRLEDSNGYGETIYDAVTGEEIIPYITCVLPIEYA